MTLIVSSNADLRTAIQTAKGSGFTAGTFGDPTIQLNGTATFSLTIPTLGKLTCVTPQEVQYSGYTIEGQSSTLSNSAKLQNTRIFQENIDTPQGIYLPGLVQNLTFNYTSSSLNTNAILSLQNRATRSLTIDTVDFTGSHSGWASNGGVYMTLTAAGWSSNTPMNTTLTLNKVNVSLSGQSGFAANTFSGGSSFLQVANNKAKVTLSNSVFDEAGFSNSFNFANYPGKPTSLQTYEIIQNTFKRTSNKDVRKEGNSLQNINATLSGNAFQDGSYLDLYGDITGVAFQNDSLGNGNSFTTIANGFGIRVTAAAGAPRNVNLTGPPTFSGTTTFTGPGLALKYESASAGFINYFNASSPASNTFTVNGANYNRLIAGGQADDTMSLFSTLNGPPQTNAWISGDTGNDSIVAGPLNDYLLGGSGNDTLRGQAGNDIIDGGIGDDLIEGQVGNDTLTGGTGADRFRYIGGAQSDVITDFQKSESDQLSLGTVNFALTGSTINNPLSSGSFQQIAAPTSSSWTPSASIANKVTILNTQTTTSLMNSVTTTTTGSAYVMFFDGSQAWLYLDTSWNNATGPSDRQALASFSNITNLNDLIALTRQEFFYA